MLIRNLITIILTVCILAAVSLTPAASEDMGRIAIIDASMDTRPYLPHLKAAGVKVIGRYYSRCQQPKLTEKRIVDNGSDGKKHVGANLHETFGGKEDQKSEINEILNEGFAVLSIYQYYSNSANKFIGRSKTNSILKNDKCEEQETAHTTEKEAELDAKAAIAQADHIGQPKRTAIFFGVDFNFDINKDKNVKPNMLLYYRTVSRILKENDYMIGIYANGDTFKFLQDKKHNGKLSGQNLIDFKWISPSRAYSGTSEFHNDGKWHLFQSRADIKWFTNVRGLTPLGLDTNVQNKNFATQYIGFWTRKGQYEISKKNTDAIYDQRRFACNGLSLVNSKKPNPNIFTDCDQIVDKKTNKPKHKPDLRPRICFADPVRVRELNVNLLQVDYNEDGEFEGDAEKTHFTSSFDKKPEYIFGRDSRRNAECPKLNKQ